MTCFGDDQEEAAWSSHGGAGTLPTSTFKADTTNIDFPCLFYKVLEEEKRLRDMCQVSGQHDLNRSQMVRFLAVFGFPDERGR